MIVQKLRYLGVTYDNYTVYDARSNAVLKLLTPFVLKEWKDFCLLNLIERIKYNLCLAFILNGLRVLFLQHNVLVELSLYLIS